MLAPPLSCHWLGYFHLKAIYWPRGSAWMAVLGGSGEVWSLQEHPESLPGYSGYSKQAG